MAEQLSFGIIITNPAAYRRQQQRKERRCLSCERDFLSTGPGNRICDRCRQLDAFSGLSEHAIHAAF